MNEKVQQPNEETRTVNNDVENSQASPKIEEKHVPNEAVLIHLLEMCKVYDLSDEMGR